MSLADRTIKAFSDVTVGTVIVLVHSILAKRQTYLTTRKRDATRLRSQSAPDAPPVMRDLRSHRVV